MEFPGVSAEGGAEATSLARHPKWLLPTLHTQPLLSCASLCLQLCSGQLMPHRCCCMHCCCSSLEQSTYIDELQPPDAPPSNVLKFSEFDKSSLANIAPASRKL